MFITKKHLTRRTFLRGLGATLGLPLLDAMIPARTALAQTAAKATPHMGFIYFPHGAVMNHWTPASEGAIGELGDILKPLDKYKAMTTVFSNIDNQAPIGPVHALSPGTWLSCVRPAISQEPHGGITIDQIAAQHIGQDTPLPSLEVATEGRGGGGFCDRDYGCSYAGTISFRTPTTPLPMETDPRKLFNRLFGQGDNAAERARLSKQYGSLLDMVTSEVNDAAAQPRAVRQARCCPTTSRPSAKSSAAFRRWRRATCRTSTSRTRRRARRPSTSTST